MYLVGALCHYFCFFLKDGGEGVGWVIYSWIIIGDVPILSIIGDVPIHSIIGDVPIPSIIGDVPIHSSICVC